MLCCSLPAGEDEALARLERALLWRAGEAAPRGGLAASLLGHAIAAAASVAWSFGVPAASRPAPPPPSVIRLIAPHLPPARESPDRLLRPGPAAGLEPPKPEPAAALPAPEVAVELSSLELSFADDTQNQLPEVVRHEGGMLALLDQEDLTIARYLVVPPDWDVRPTVADVSRKLRILMDPPRKWEVLRAVAKRNGIALDRYRACAIFDTGYRRCIQNAIRARALERAPGFSGRVTAARLAFSAGRPCGIKVLEVSLATSSSRP